MNAYVGGGYGAAAGILGLYAVYIRRRARVLARALPESPSLSAADAPVGAAEARPTSDGEMADDRREQQ
jgi:hypothetical protein